MKKMIILTVLLGISAFGHAQDKSVVEVVPPAEYRELISEPEVQLIDVRTPEEFEEGHIEGAHNIDFFAADFLEQFEKFKKQQPVYIYCRSGNRSAKAAVKLSEAGFEKIFDLEGGFRAWSAKDKAKN